MGIDRHKDQSAVTLYIMRHGKTMLNAMNRVQGWCDSFLTPEGEKVVRYAGKGLKDVEFTSAYSSDSGRSIQTANIILEANSHSKDLHLQTDSRLREFNFGSFEGDLNDDILEKVAQYYGKPLKAWVENDRTPENLANCIAELDKENVQEDDVNWPAEDYNTIKTRLRNAITEIVKKESQNGGGNILIVAHGLSITTILDIYLNETPSEDLSNAGVSTITYKDGEFKLGVIDDLSYIKTGKEQTEAPLV